MNISDELISKLAELSKLDFEGSEKEAIRQDLQRMLDFVQSLMEVDTENTEPLIHVTDEVNRFSPDEPVTDITRAEALKNAPDADSDYFRVPKFSKKSS